MSDPVDTILAEVHAELDRFMLTEVAWTARADVKHRCKSPPFIAWSEVGGKSTFLDGNEDGKLFDDVVAFEINCWAKNRGDARKLCWNLQKAARRILGATLIWGSKSSVTESDSGPGWRGYVIGIRAELTLAIDDQPEQLTGLPEPLEEYQLREVIRATDQTPE